MKFQDSKEALNFTKSLECWTKSIEICPISGGISNYNFLVTHGNDKFVIRVNGDVPEHGVSRLNDFNCNTAAAKAGVAPPVFYYHPNALAVYYIEGQPIEIADVSNEKHLQEIVGLIKTTHREASREITGSVASFWPFRICGNYISFLKSQDSRIRSELSLMMERNLRLEGIVGKVDLVLGHNDLLVTNILNDGKRLWLIDWEYAGFTSPLFDLANLSANNNLTNTKDEWILEHYFEAPNTEELLIKFNAMKCASILRETLWSFVSELQPRLAFDYKKYSDDLYQQFLKSYASLLG